MSAEKSQDSGGISSFWLKLAAIVAMTLDHISVVFGAQLSGEVNLAFHLAGGIAFPVMAFMLAEGYVHTHNLARYKRRLLLWALLAQLPYAAVLSKQLNVLFTLYLGLVCIELMEQRRGKGTLAIVLLICLSIFCDWGVAGIPMILCSYYYRDSRWKRLLYPYGISVLLFGIAELRMYLGGDVSMLPEAVFTWGGGALAALMLCRYNGRRGLSTGRFFYLYYPLHIVVLGLIFYWSGWAA